MSEEKWITVEFCGERKTIPVNLLSKAKETSDWMIKAMMDHGHSKEESEKIYGLKIVKESQSAKK